ncbi:hypothetical protein L2E82_07794 [Cichorium intybus]|uniref:Uncharacterized protein n=1 Tax=Cichorium intybus TaxID=13427 RepID=A0ACB9G5X4_CICIN|nr:hypothetical protein L2E82_07794 [Cichorium intybus]
MGAPKQKWTSEEEAALKAGILKHGAGKWRIILKDPEFSSVLYLHSNVDLKVCIFHSFYAIFWWKVLEKARLALKRVQHVPKDDNPLAVAIADPSDEDSGDMRPIHYIACDNGFVKLTKAEKRAKLKKLRKEAKKQGTPVTELEEVQQSSQAEVLLAELGTATLTDPEENIKFLKEMLQICKDGNQEISVLGLKSLLAVFKDITPGTMLVELLKSSSSGDPRSSWKVLIMDKVIVKVMSSVCKMTDITDRGVSYTDTDEIYAQMSLRSVNSEKDVLPIPDFGMKPSRHPSEFFCKTLTPSDTNRHGSFSVVPRRPAE